MISVRVQGGTNAGRKRPLREPREPWWCGCLNLCGLTGNAQGKLNPGWRSECLDCGVRRDP